MRNFCNVKRERAWIGGKSRKHGKLARESFHVIYLLINYYIRFVG
jgi:hypothetical protein